MILYFQHADDRTGGAEEGVVDVGVAFPAGAVAGGTGAVKPVVRVPALSAETGVMRLAEPGDDRGDAVGGEPSALFTWK